ELKNYLENQLKQPGEKGGIADQVLQIVILQIKAMELKMSISGKLKTQAQMDGEFLITAAYPFSFFRFVFTDKLLTALEKEILDLNNELSALKLTSVQLDEQTKEFDGKRIEIMDKTAKFKGKDEIISRILKLQFEFMEALIMAQGQMKADELKINALQITLLGFEINQIMKQIKASSSNDVLKRIRDEKLKELTLKKEELQKSDPSSEKILKVISQMEEIWKLQSEDPDNLNKISSEYINYQYYYYFLFVSVLKIIALQSDVTWIKEMLKTVTTQAEIQKAELQKALDDVKRLLNEKNKELAAGTGDEKDIAALKKKVLTLQNQKDTIEKNTMQKIKDLQDKLKQSNGALDDANKQLKEKNATLSKQITNINNLLDEVRTLKQQVQGKESQVNARIADLERSLTMKKEENAKILAENEKLRKDCVGTAECPEFQKKYNEMQAEYNDTISKLNNDILKKAYIIKILMDEVQYLDQQTAQGSPGNEELEAKKQELKEAKQKLDAEGPISSKTLEVLELLTNIGKLQENPTEDNSEKIQLEAQLNGLLAELQNSGEKGLGLALKIMSIKESMSKLKQAQAQMQENYAKEINGLKNQIENKEKEILLLRGNCELSDKIQNLEKELEESKQNFKKLQQESNDKIASLQKQIKSKDQQLANTEDQLEKINAKNAALIKQLNNLNDDLKNLKEEKNKALLNAKEEIDGLKEKLQKQEKALTEKDLYLKEKNEVIAALEKQQESTKGELEQVKNKNKELETELKTKDQQLVKTEAKIKEINAENQDLGLEKTLEAKKQELAKKDQQLQKKDKEVSTLQKENADTKAELKEEKKKINGEWAKCNQTKKMSVFVPTSDWPRFDANTAHRRLVLSQNEKEVHTSLFPKPVPDNPERYDTAIAALGKEGFDSGKHYWEIGVTGSKCYVVGAAKESAQRKGILKYGPSAGYWVIQRNRDTKLFANADRRINLNVQAPSVIGILLDFKNNKVNFYNADTKLEIFSFTGSELQGKIYPYVETCSDTTLNEPPLILKKPTSTDWLKQ
uniref:Si:ch211-14a17.10 n=1 Tax=Cyprinus carpio carpio TaxID=630221 RepID=A0A8C1E392_CYPCA